ncbi:protein-glutamine gamma-glutamyltransferase [Thalassobacillus sp. CUG 92003]|uniref:protein-glutamine gamma-glutamyltransferase n=1 Tax=Thalassobacillus sp. CUG 92003 TaxID=2736641 RepID=UPI0015E76164|nr:protein-glutamine gamma-glutamyltransferase [Thalassobacillus sp. CUG 92003]
MIHVAGSPLQESGNWPAGSIESMIIQLMVNSPYMYTYRSMESLAFELKLRKNIVSSARQMEQSGVSFATFAETYVNPRYWTMNEFGGIQLRADARPSAAIRDIYTNGSDYGFECAGAMLIIYYHAALNVFGEATFNRIFPNLYIYSWHADTDLGLSPIQTSAFLPGDVVYFENPDFDPRASQWRGENAVVLGDGLYFGHGIGILSAEKMIESLNRKRRPGAFQSAYLSHTVVRPNFQYLERFARQRAFAAVKYQSVVITHNEDSISLIRYRLFLSMVYNGGQ